jgi:integrase/recombinase XerD
MKLELGEPPENMDPYEAFIYALNAAGAGEGTIKLYSIAIKDFLNFIKKDPKKVSTDDINKWIIDLMSRKGKILDPIEQRRARNSTIRSYVIAVKRFLKWLGVSVKPIIPRIRRREPRILKEEEVERVLLACKRLRDKVIISLLLDTGLRAKELLSLNKSDIDLENRSIRVRNSKNGEERIVFFTTRTADLIKKYLRNHKNEKLFNISYQALYKLIKRIGKKVGLDLRPHLIRHTFATNAIKKGLPLPVVQKLLGHKDIKTTQIYLHLVNEDIKKLYDKTFNTTLQ